MMLWRCFENYTVYIWGPNIFLFIESKRFWVMQFRYIDRFIKPITDNNGKMMIQFTKKLHYKSIKEPTVLLQMDCSFQMCTILIKVVKRANASNYGLVDEVSSLCLSCSTRKSWLHLQVQKKMRRSQTRTLHGCYIEKWRALEYLFKMNISLVRTPSLPVFDNIRHLAQSKILEHNWILIRRLLKTSFFWKKNTRHRLHYWKKERATRELTAFDRTDIMPNNYVCWHELTKHYSKVIVQSFAYLFASYLIMSIILVKSI